MDNCLFCKIIDRNLPAEIVYESEDILAFNDINPQAPTHIIIVPKTHLETMDEINESNFNLAGKLILTASKLASELKLKGYRFVINCNEIAGQSVFHLHCHLIAGRRMHWPPG